MKIDMQGFDLSGFLEAHREAILFALPANYMLEDKNEIAHAHDRATTKGLLAVIQGQQSAPVASLVVAGGGVTAGSKAARDRAKKAARTRKQNIEKAATGRTDDLTPNAALDTAATVGGGE